MVGRSEWGQCPLVRYSQSVSVRLCSGADDFFLVLSSVVVCWFGCFILEFALSLKDFMLCTIISLTSDTGCF